MLRLLLISIFVCLSLSVTSLSQSKQRTKEKSKPVAIGCDHCVLPIYSPKPVYPAIAKAVRASGPVSVSIKINKKGHVYWARAVSGHLFLRAAAEKAAKQNRYAIIYPNGKPVNLNLTIVYNFVL
ncbi:MAG: energy transducer TonB [Pyrinomonadaceae bacterium]